MRRFFLVIILLLCFTTAACGECEHEYIQKESIPSTCEEQEVVYECTKCGHTIHQISVGEGHKYSETVIKEATYTQAGEVMYTCSVCGDSYTEATPIKEEEVTVVAIGKNSVDDELFEYIEITFEITNHTDKSVIGIDGNVEISDLYDRQIAYIPFTIAQKKIQAGETITVVGTQYMFSDELWDAYYKDFDQLIINYDIVDIAYLEDEVEQRKEETFIETNTCEKVTVTVTDKHSLEENWDRGRYSPRVEFDFSISNNTDKPIKGVDGTLTIYDMFDQEIIVVSADFTEHIIKPTETATYEGIGIDVNQFRTEHVRLYSEDYENLSFKYDVSMIVYEDGTKEEF